MTRERQISIALWSFRVAIIIFFLLVIFCVVSAKGAGASGSNTNTFSDTMMWVFTGFGAAFMGIFTILIKHESDITGLKTHNETESPHVLVSVCDVNMKHLTSELSHGTERFKKLEESQKEKDREDKRRHEEIMNAIKGDKK